MKILLIGHRGSGKTSLLQRLNIYVLQQKLNPKFFDLDRELMRESGQPIDLLFSLGEEKFRQKEIHLLNKLRSSFDSYVIALGGGTLLDQIEKKPDEQWVWVRRASDSLGRYFLDRPRLNPELDWKEEQTLRFHEREKRFREHCSWIYDLSEGSLPPTAIEKEIFFPSEKSGDNNENFIGGGVSLRPEHFSKNGNTFKRRWDFFELRDDVFTQDLISQHLGRLPEQKRLFAARNRSQSLEFLKLVQKSAKIDWAMELGPCPLAKVDIISSHSKNPPEGDAHLKFSPMIESWDELWTGLRWQEQSPQKHSFLPRSQSLDLKWVRLWLKGRQQMQFVNDGWNEEGFQPSLFQWMSSPWLPQNFAAVLGDPVHLSYSPIEHLLFFSERKMPFWPIQIRRRQLENVFPNLQKMGLRAAAVTSPLKLEMHHLATDKSPITDLLKSANTVVCSGQSVRVHNTDIDGFRAATEVLNSAEQTKVAIWGGGGVLQTILNVFPQAVHFSIESTMEEAHQMRDWKGIIWAGSPNAELPKDHLPNLEWIFDLNYREDSNARILASRLGVRYISGAYMFHEQARSQQEFWSANGFGNQIPKEI